MKKTILIVLLVMALIAVTTGCGNQNNSQSSAQSTSVSVPSQAEEEEDLGEFALFSIPAVAPNQAECATEINVTAGGTIKYTLEAEKGTGIFIAASTEYKDSVAADKMLWLYYYENKDGSTIEETATVTTDGTLYFYVGSLGDPIEYASGNIDWTPKGK